MPSFTYEFRRLLLNSPCRDSEHRVFLTDLCVQPSRSGAQMVGSSQASAFAEYRENTFDAYIRRQISVVHHGPRGDVVLLRFCSTRNGPASTAADRSGSIQPNGTCTECIGTNSAELSDHRLFLAAHFESTCLE